MKLRYQQRNVLLLFSVGLIFGFGLSGCSSGQVKSDDGRGSPGVSATTDTDGPVTETGIAPAKIDAAPVPVEAPKNVSVDSRYKILGAALRDSAAKPGQVQEEAIRILGANPNDAIALNSLAMLHLHHGRTGAAKLLLARALEKNPPEAAGLHNNMGVALLDESQQDSAIVEFKKALALDPNHTEALGNLGSIYVKAGDHSKALPMLETSYKRNRNNVAILNNYAIALRGNKDLEGAKRVYEEALKINSRDVNTIFNLAILYIDFMNRAKDGLDLVYKVKFIETQRKDVLSRANALEKKAKSELK